MDRPRSDRDFVLLIAEILIASRDVPQQLVAVTAQYGS